MTTYKPSELFIGVFEFFAILLPGAALMFLLQNSIVPVFEALLPRLHNELQGWIAFLFAAYIAGHFLHLFGFLLDQYLYDELYKPLKLKEGKTGEILLARVRHIIVSRYGLSSEDVNHLSLFMWAGSVVRTLNSAASQELDRGGAESKFFRSWVYVFFLGVVLSLVHQSLTSAVICLVLTFFSLWRFMDLRWKNSQLTYEYFLILNCPEQSKEPEQSIRKPSEASRHLTLGIELRRLNR
jgi:hypothetical protein